MKVIPETRHMH